MYTPIIMAMESKMERYNRSNTGTLMNSKAKRLNMTQLIPKTSPPKTMERNINPIIQNAMARLANAAGGKYSDVIIRLLALVLRVISGSCGALDGEKRQRLCLQRR